MFAEPGFFDNVRIKNGINSAVILCLCSLAGYCHAEAAKLIGQRIQPREMWLIPRPDWLRLISLGFDDLAADLSGCSWFSTPAIQRLALKTMAV